MKISRLGWLLLLLAVTVNSVGCASSGRAVRPAACPVMPPLPQQLQKKTDYAGQVRLELYDSASLPSPSATKP